MTDIIKLKKVTPVEATHVLITFEEYTRVSVDVEHFVMKVD